MLEERSGLSRACAGLLGAALLLSLDGCVVDFSGGGAEGGGSATGSTGSVPSSSSSGVPPGCELSEAKPIPADCGIFVRAGATGDGSQANPLGDIRSALAAITDKPRVYVCGSDTFTGSLSMPSGVSIFGAVDCATWTFQAVNPAPKVVGDADVPAVSVTAGPDTSFIGYIDIEAVDAVSVGASSVAVFGAGAGVGLFHSKVKAGHGGPGKPGDMPNAPMQQAPGGGTGSPGCGSTSPGNSLGGSNTCGADNVSGGLGGPGTNQSNGGSGAPGGPAGTGGPGGNGQEGGNCVDGGSGDSGAVGDPGVLATEFGSVDADGFTPAAAIQAAAGHIGKGGGGGGGGKQCSGGMVAASGGGGGAGGCGGNGGFGGGAGGGSFAVLFWASSVSLTEVSLTAGIAGDGGAGADGQVGQQGGGPGTHGDDANNTATEPCNGGGGGSGGRGGPGAGGNGGTSALIAFSGGGFMRAGDSSHDVLGTAGVGGPGSSNQATVPAAPNGAPGSICSRLDIEHTNCSP